MAQQPLDPEAENEKLNVFLFEMDDRQEAFTAKLDAQGYHLDYTLSMLPDLERYLKAHRQQMDWKDKSAVAVGLRADCWSYLGETFRQTFGGGWEVSLTDPSSVNYGKWVVSGFDALEVEFEPLGTLQGYLLRGKPGTLRRALESKVHATPLDLSHLPEED